MKIIYILWNNPQVYSSIIRVPQYNIILSIIVLMFYIITLSFFPPEAIAQSISIISRDGNNFLLKYPDSFASSITSSNYVTFIINAESVNNGIAEFECALDGEPFVSCPGLGVGEASSNGTGSITYRSFDSTSYSNLSVGPHSFEAGVTLSDGRQIISPYFSWEIADHPIDLSLNRLGLIQSHIEPDILVDGKKTVGKIELDSTLSLGKMVNLRVYTGHPLISSPFFDTGNIPVRIDDSPVDVHYTSQFDAPTYGWNYFFTHIFGPILCIDAYIDSDNKIAEINEENNRKQSCYFVKDTKPFSTIFVPVKLEGDTYSRTVSQEELETTNTLSSHFIKGTYPIDEDEYFSSIVPMELTITSPTHYLDWCYTVNHELEGFRYMTELFGSQIIPDNVIGVVNRTISGLQQTLGADGIACSGIHGVTILLTGDKDDVAHEIAHTYGWVTPDFCIEYGNCDSERHPISLPAHGYWVEEQREMHAIDFMGPEGGGWISKYTFDYLLDKLQTNPSGSKAIAIRGTIYNNGTAELDPWYKLNSTEYSSSVISGKYTSSIIDRNGTEISQTKFELNYPQMPGSGLELDRGYFSLIIPDLADAFKIIIKNGTETLAERQVISNPPKIQITSPNSSLSFEENDLVKIKSVSSDPDKDDKLTYSVALSIDGGKIWFPISIEQDDDKFEFITPQNISTNSALIKVAINDGINTVFDTLNSTFTIVNDRNSISSDVNRIDEVE